MLTFQEIKQRVETNPLYTDFLKIIYESWTWKRLTLAERNAFIRILWKPYIEDQIKSCRKEDTRSDRLNVFYDIYLEGCGYDHRPSWREKDRTSRQLKKVVGLAKSLIEAVDELNGEKGLEDNL